MSFLEFPIRRYQFTLVAFLCLVALGWYAFASVPREEDPYFKIPGFTVAAIYPGADPKDLERLVAKPLEDKFAALDDVRKMETSIRDGVSFTAIEFLASTDADKKYDEVTRELNALRPEFPPDVHIIVRRFSRPTGFCGPTATPTGCRPTRSRSRTGSPQCRRIRRRRRATATRPPGPGR